MSSIVDVQIIGPKVVLKLPQKDIVHEVDNVAVFDSVTKELLHVGLAPGAFQVLYPKKWEKHKDKLEFVPIFAKDTFSPEAGAMLLWDWWSQIKRQVVRQIYVFGHQAKLELHIAFEGYEQNSQEQKDEFEYLLFRFLYLEKLFVNKKEKQLSQKSFLPETLLTWMSLIGSVILFFLLSFPVSAAMFWISKLALPPVYVSTLYVLVFLGISVPVIYLGRSLLFLLWLQILKPYFEPKILRFALSYQGSPQKKQMSKTEIFLLSRILPN